MSTFNSLSYATQLVATGLPREQAEVHANALQNVYDEEHKQYATKADFIALSSAVKLQIHQLEIKTDRIETKTDQLEIKTDRIEAKMLQIEVKTYQSEIKTIQIEAKTDQIEIKMTQIEKKIDQVEQKLSSVQTLVAQESSGFPLAALASGTFATTSNHLIHSII